MILFGVDFIKYFEYFVACYIIRNSDTIDLEASTNIVQAIVEKTSQQISRIRSIHYPHKFLRLWK